jgi:MFS family permease
MYGGFTAGWIVAALAAIGIVPSFGWRPIILFGAPADPFYPDHMEYLPESVRFLAGKKQYPEAIREMRKIEKLTGQKPLDWQAEDFAVAVAEGKMTGTIKDLFTPRLIRMTILISGTYFFNLIVVYGLSSWLPTLLVQKGFSLVKSYKLRHGASHHGLGRGVCYRFFVG